MSENRKLPPLCCRESGDEVCPQHRQAFRELYGQQAARRREKSPPESPQSQDPGRAG